MAMTQDNPLTPRGSVSAAAAAATAGGGGGGGGGSSGREEGVLYFTCTSIDSTALCWPPL